MTEFINCTDADFSDPKSLRVLKAVSVTDDWIKTDKGESFHKATCFPIEAHEDLIAALTEREKLKKALDKSMGLIYQTRNKYGNVK